MSPCLCPCPHQWRHFLCLLLQGQLLPATRYALGRGELAGLAPATLSVPLPALGLSLPGSRGHYFRGCHTANPTSSFATTCGCHHRGAISNKMRHSPTMLGSLQHSLPRRVPPHKVLAVWGDPWDVGSTLWSGFAHTAGQTHRGSPNPRPQLWYLPAL